MFELVLLTCAHTVISYMSACVSRLNSPMHCGTCVSSISPRYCSRLLSSSANFRLKVYTTDIMSVVLVSVDDFHQSGLSGVMDGEADKAQLINDVAGDCLAVDVFPRIAATSEFWVDNWHFTEDGYSWFCDSFVEATARHLRKKGCHLEDGWWMLVADSTIDFANWTSDGAWTGEGDRCITEAFADRGMKVVVDAVGGSGFLAGRRTFRRRMQDHKARFATWYPYTGVILLGGFNDCIPKNAFSRSAIEVAVADTLSVAHQLCEW